MKYVIKFDITSSDTVGSHSYFSSIGVTDCQSYGSGLYMVTMDGEQLVMVVLKFPKAEIYRPMRKE